MPQDFFISFLSSNFKMHYTICLTVNVANKSSTIAPSQLLHHPFCTHDKSTEQIWLFNSKWNFYFSSVYRHFRFLERQKQTRSMQWHHHQRLTVQDGYYTTIESFDLWIDSITSWRFAQSVWMVSKCKWKLLQWKCFGIVFVHMQMFVRLLKMYISLR